MAHTAWLYLYMYRGRAKGGKRKRGRNGKRETCHGAERKSDEGGRRAQRVRSVIVGKVEADHEMETER